MDSSLTKNCLVSIIVPAYNVETYIDKCILSILNQTYTNIEVLIVNDGSIDRTAALADAFSKRDTRVHVIHKNNKGVSAARNTGLDASAGDYVIFVDADDYIAPDYVEYMLHLAEQTNADFCLSKSCYTKQGENQTITDKVEVLSPEDATALLLSPGVIVGCWNKIFKRSFLDERNLRFSEALFYGEGLLFITTAAQLSNRIGVGNRKVYYYRRNNETSATTSFNINKLYNGEFSLQTISDNLLIKSSKVQNMLTLHICMFSLGAAVRLNASGLVKHYHKDYVRWMSYVRKNMPKLLLKKDISLYRKLLLWGGCLCPKLISGLDIIRRKRISANSVNS